MDTHCQICGCITEESQLGDYEISGRTLKACRICRKSLDSIKQNPAVHAGEAYNIVNMNTGSRRSAEVQNLLVAHFASLGVAFQQAPPAAPVQPMPPVQPVQTAQPVQQVTYAASAQGNTEQELAQLRKEFDELKKSYEGFRRRYYIAKIISITLPILLVIIMFIIMIKSGALENLFNYYNTIVEYANM